MAEETNPRQDEGDVYSFLGDSDRSLRQNVREPWFRDGVKTAEGLPSIDDALNEFENTPNSIFGPARGVVDALADEGRRCEKDETEFRDQANNNMDLAQHNEYEAEQLPEGDEKQEYQASVMALRQEAHLRYGTAERAGTAAVICAGAIRELGTLPHDEIETRQKRVERGGQWPEPDAKFYERKFLVELVEPEDYLQNHLSDEYAQWMRTERAWHERRRKLAQTLIKLGNNVGNRFGARTGHIVNKVVTKFLTTAGLPTQNIHDVPHHPGNNKPGSPNI